MPDQTMGGWQAGDVDAVRLFVPFGPQRCLQVKLQPGAEAALPDAEDIETLADRC